MKVPVSDPTRTILDVLNAPLLGGGLRSTTDFLINYLKSENHDLGLLIDYADQLGNGAVFKRLGFLLERLLPEKQGVIDACRVRIGPKYVFQCGLSGKIFPRKTHNSKLNPHKDKQGFLCPGRAGLYVTTKY